MSVIVEIDEVPLGTPPPVQVVDSVLPDGASTAALQTSGNASLTAIDGKVQPGVTTITHYSIIINTADTEYSQALPANTRILSFRTRELNDIRYAFVTGKVAGPVDPYVTLRAGEIFSERNLNLTGKTLYVGSDIGAIHVEVEVGS